MEIRTKLYLSILATGVLLAISGYLLYGQISKVSESFDEVQNKATPSIIALGNIKSDFNELAAAILAFNLHAPEAASDPVIKETALEHLQEVKDTKAKLQSSYDSYKALGQDPDGVSRIGERIQSIVALTDEMTTVGVDVMNNGGTAHDASGTAAGGTSDHMASEGILHLHKLVGDFDEQAMAFRDELDEKIQANYVSLKSTENNVLADIQNTINVNIILTAVVALVVLVVGGLVVYSITKRVTQLKRNANEVASGNLGQQIATQGSDEITALASSFEHMRRSLVQTQNELKDRSEQVEKANVELKKLDKLKDEFIGVAAHELRTPIHPILGYASMARDGMIPAQKALDMTYSQALRLKQLANDILDVSRIESGTLPYSMKKVRINELLKTCADAVKPNIRPGVSLITKFDSNNEEIEIAGDRERLTQVLMNVIGNAIKFTENGKIIIQTQIEKENNNFVVTVSDTAGGIPAEILATLFGKFVTKKVGENVSHGTGLGLFLSKAIVTAHRGKISAYNNDIGGATFKIELPLNTDKQDLEQSPLPMNVVSDRKSQT